MNGKQESIAPNFMVRFHGKIDCTGNLESNS